MVSDITRRKRFIGKVHTMNESKTRQDYTELYRVLNEWAAIVQLPEEEKGRRLMELVGGLTESDAVWAGRVLETSRAGSVTSRAYLEAVGKGASDEEGLSAAHSAWLDATADWNEAQWDHFERTVGDASEGKE